MIFENMNDPMFGKTTISPKEWVEQYIKQKAFQHIEKYDDEIILFLDFDGVTHPMGAYFPMEKEPSDRNQWSGGSFTEWDRIVAILDKFPNVNIVFSTSWGNYFKFEQLQAIFDSKEHHRVLGKTNDCFDYSRGLCCREWLRANNMENVAWIAVDDLAIFENSDPVVRTDLDSGITDESFKILIEALNNPLEYAIFCKN